MPVYEYFCRSCNTRYDKLRPLRDADTPTNCPSCNEQNSVRTLSVFITMSSGGESRRAGSEAISHSGCACGGACGCASKN